MDEHTFKPRRLKIVEPGWEGYSDMFGLVLFKDGVSVEPVGWREASLIGGLVRIEDANEADFQINSGAEYNRVKDRTTDSPVVSAVDRGTHVVDEAHARYTRKQLEELADEKGLAGVREVARLWGRTGRSINECIDAVLTAQNEVAKPAGE